MNPLTNTKNLQKINQKELELGLSGTKSSWHDGYKDSAWIFVGGLPYDLTEGDIITVFSQYGEIVNINLVRDKQTGKQKGYAFVCYEDQRSTVLAVDNLNAIKLLNRTLRVDHVMNYKVPEIKGDEDELTKKIKLEGCAPEVRIEKAMKKLKKKERKDKDGEPDEGVNSKSWKKEPKSRNGSDVDEDVKEKIAVEGDSQTVGQHRDSGSRKVAKIRSEKEHDQLVGSAFGDRRSKDSMRSKEDEEKQGGDLKFGVISSSHRRREDGGDDEESRRQKRKRRERYDNDYKKSSKHRSCDDDDDEPSKHRRNDKDNENRSPKSRRKDDGGDDPRSSKLKRHRDDDDDYRSSRNKRDGEGRRRERSLQRWRRDRS